MDTVVLSDYCLIAKEIPIVADDVLNKDTLEKILDHNKTYDFFCRKHPTREL